MILEEDINKEVPKCFHKENPGNLTTLEKNYIEEKEFVCNKCNGYDKSCPKYTIPGVVSRTSKLWDD